MNCLLLTLMVLLQSASTMKGGTVTGVVRDADDTPLGGVRVAAMPTTDPSGGNSTLVSLAVTDQTGHYKLEVPAGPYFIAAGRVDAPTYYPGVRGRESAAVVSIASGSAVSGMDFVIFSVGGVVRNAKGDYLAGIRVAAREASNAVLPTVIGKTDDTGRFRLEVPSGNYYVSAGRVGRSTYYPGTTNAGTAASITVGFGAGASGLDFSVSDESTEMRPEDLYLSGVEQEDFGRYDEARLLFQSFISTYPQNEYFSHAKYAFADSFYREGTAEAMVLAKPLFESFLKQFPELPQAADARQRLKNIQEHSGRQEK